MRVLILLLVSACGHPDALNVLGVDPGSLQVIVTDDLNHGVLGIRLTLSRTGRDPLSGMSGNDGTFVFAGVTPGSWTLAAEAGGGFNLGPGELGQRPVSVSSNSTVVQQIRVVPGPLRGTIVGQVTHGGTGVGAVQLMFHGAGGREARFTTADDGRFRLQGVDAGSGVLDVGPPSYFSMAVGQPQSRAVTVGGNDSVSVNILLAPVGGPITIDISLLLDSYDPDDVFVPPGVRIRWTNIFDKPHTISPGGHWAWRVVEMSRHGEQFEIVLNNPGIYSYLCEYLYLTAGMTGYITVVP
ncbi:MAG: hypothetical protein EXR93_09770 [Gemmatimonadetes bacterium]|nr:hypothetical protein [Gemmatimonadota bacterium]